MSRYVVNATWSDVPHLTQEEQDELWRSIPNYQRQARSKGIPVLGSGVIYPFDEERVKVAPVDIPKHWPRCFGMDTDAGAGWTAIAWLAWDRDQKTVYVYRCYKSDSHSLPVHAEALTTQGKWIPGVADAAGLLVTEKDSIQVIELYKAAGIDIELPDKSVEAGIQDVYDLFEAGRLKVFATCSDWFTEFRQYHRDKGKIVKSNDHLMDATRYGIRSGLARAKVKPKEAEQEQRYVYAQGHSGTGWMGM